jgi:hypothetical protein
MTCSSVIKALLRLSNGEPTAAVIKGVEGNIKEDERVDSLAERFADTGGVYTLFLLLHHEVPYLNEDSQSNVTLGKIVCP